MIALLSYIIPKDLHTSKTGCPSPVFIDPDQRTFYYHITHETLLAGTVSDDSIKALSSLTPLCMLRLQEQIISNFYISKSNFSLTNGKVRLT